MTVAHVEFLVEEQSMEAALRQLLPRLLGTTSFDVHPFQGKMDLLAHLPNRLHAYRSWLPPDWRIVVLADCDNDDCTELKERLESTALLENFSTKSNPGRNGFQVLNRIAIEELEAWYFGDWNAVKSAYPRVPASIPEKAAYRQPDAIENTWEALERVMRKAGYFQNGLRKIELARNVGAHLDPDRNTSPSFCALRDALREL